jgi:ABC-type polysaccharide/polyol phosphate transport system ATPase subunit
VLALVGLNGAGKTALVRILATSLPPTLGWHR